MGPLPERLEAMVGALSPSGWSSGLQLEDTGLGDLGF